MTNRNPWQIVDWAGNLQFNGMLFNTFDAAEEYLGDYLAEERLDYEEWRQEYEIVQAEGNR
jgi:hypothetical protein